VGFGQAALQGVGQAAHAGTGPVAEHTDAKPGQDAHDREHQEEFDEGIASFMAGWEGHGYLCGISVTLGRERIIIF